MKKTILSAAMTCAIAASAFAVAQDKPKDPQMPKDTQSQSQSQTAKSVRGSITSIDNANKSMVIKDEAAGKEVTVYWDASTKVNGDLKVGNMVSLQTSDQSGRMVATSIDATGAKKPY